MKTRYSWFWIAVILFFSALVIIQHHYVFLYFDDFGYASLSYGRDLTTGGLEFSIRDILSYLSFHYFSWGGRILYFFFEIMIFRFGGLALMQIIQALIFIMILLLSGYLSALMFSRSPLPCAALSFLLFGLISLTTLRDGFYWYSASVLYIWPLLPLLAAAVLLQSRRTPAAEHTAAHESPAGASGIPERAPSDSEASTVSPRAQRLPYCILVCMLVFLAAFSQEQNAVLTLSFCIFYLLISLYVRRFQTRPALLAALCAAALAGAAICILAPGNFVRASDSYGLSSLSGFLHMLADNYAEIMDNNFGSYNWLFVAAFTLICGCAMHRYYRDVRITLVSEGFLIFFLTEHFLYLDAVAFGAAVRTVWAIFFLVLLSVFYYRERQFLFLALLWGGVCSQAMMVVSPSISIRCHSMMEMILLMVLSHCILLLHSDAARSHYCPAFAVLLALLSVISLRNYISNLTGYARNAPAHRELYAQMEKAAKKWTADGSLPAVTVPKLNDDQYANQMPYDNIHYYAETWIKNYFSLPAFTIINWSDDAAGDAFSCEITDGSWYSDCWLSDSVALSIRSQTERLLALRISNPILPDGSYLECTLNGRSASYPVMSGNNIIYLRVPEGTSQLQLSASGTTQGTGGDKRKLSMVLQIVP